MNEQNKKEQAILWRAAMMALGRSLRHEYQNKQEELPERMHRLVAELEMAGAAKDDERHD
jgi:hypothetical protein